MSQPEAETNETPSSKLGMVWVTASSQSEAEAIAQALVREKLAACVSIAPIQSIYIWQGEICREQEWQLVIKTNLADFPQLEAKIRAMHSYEVPEILALPIATGSQPYLQWMLDSTT